MRDKSLSFQGMTCDDPILPPGRALELRSEFTGILPPAHQAARRCLRETEGRSGWGPRPGGRLLPRYFPRTRGYRFGLGLNSLSFSEPL